MGKEFLEDLNKEQMQAATTLEGPLLVIAGAGTGKTKMLISRVANLLSEGVSPENILLLTFTKKAAKEMRDRVCAFPSIEHGERVAAQTFHSFCSDILHQYAPFIGFKNDFGIWDAPDSEDIIGMFAEGIRQQYKAQKKKLPKFPSNAAIQAIHGRWINTMKTVDYVCSYDPDINLDPMYKRDVINILKEYDEYKKSHNMMDFDDVLYWAYILLSKNEHIRARLDQHYRYIMCDEYQDTNTIQDRLLDLLSMDYPNLCVVGDDNQSIYRFRSAQVENILTFAARHNNCPTVKLIRNYRSTQEILDYANAVMSHAYEGIEKRLVGFSHGEAVQLKVMPNDFELAAFIISDIRKKLDDGVDPRSICIMGRHGDTTQIVETQLTRAHIPFQKFGGRSYFSQAIVRDILAFLRAGASTDDEIAWFRMLMNVPGVGERKARTLYQKVHENGIDELASWDLLGDKSFDYLEKVHQFLKEETTEPPVDQVTAASELYEELRTATIESMKTTENKRDELSNKLERDLRSIETLKYLAINYVSVRDMLEDFALNMPAKEDDSPKINVTTVHSAKGLEYDTVYLVNPIQGMFPRSLEDTEDTREDLRCMYVALTRAKNHLYICMAEDVSLYGRHYDGTLSYFLAYEDVMDHCKHPKDILWFLPETEESDLQYGEW